MDANFINYESGNWRGCSRPQKAITTNLAEMSLHAWRCYSVGGCCFISLSNYLIPAGALADITTRLALAPEICHDLDVDVL